MSTRTDTTTTSTSTTSTSTTSNATTVAATTSAESTTTSMAVSNVITLAAGSPKWANVTADDDDIVVVTIVGTVVVMHDQPLVEVGNLTLGGGALVLDFTQATLQAGVNKFQLVAFDRFEGLPPTNITVLVNALCYEVTRGAVLNFDNSTHWDVDFEVRLLENEACGHAQVADTILGLESWLFYLILAIVICVLLSVIVIAVVVCQRRKAAKKDDTDYASFNSSMSGTSTPVGPTSEYELIALPPASIGYEMPTTPLAPSVATGSASHGVYDRIAPVRMESNASMPATSDVTRYSPPVSVYEAGE